MAEREMLTQERVQQIVDGNNSPYGYEVTQLAHLALKQLEARALIEQMRNALKMSDNERGGPIESRMAVSVALMEETK